MTPTGPSSRRVLVASAILLGFTAVAAAQTAPAPPAPTTPGWMHHGDHGQGPQDWQAERAKMEEHRLAKLHTKLNLHPGQEPAWQAFVTGLQAARPTPKPHERPDWEKMKLETAPERLDHWLARIDEMHAHLAQLDQTVKTFYARLSKDQQTIFDDNFTFMGHGHGGPGGWNHHGMDHGPMDDGGMDHGGMGHGPMDHGPMDHGPMDHGWTGSPGMGPAGASGMTGGPPPQT